MAGVIGLLVLALRAVHLNLQRPDVLPLTQFSLSGYGFDILALYGFFSFVAFGMIYFVVPRITRREWLSRRLIKMHFFLSVYGVVTVALVALFGGCCRESARRTGKQPWEGADDLRLSLRRCDHPRPGASCCSPTSSSSSTSR